VNVVGNCVATVVVAQWEKAIAADSLILGPARVRAAAEAPAPKIAIGK
jgi:Na+/H+-dicarboxylate symporter